MARWNPFRRRGARLARHLVAQLARHRARQAGRARHRLDKKAWTQQRRREQNSQ